MAEMNRDPYWISQKSSKKEKEKQKHTGKKVKKEQVH